jgi:hypothetical protein
MKLLLKALALVALALPLANCGGSHFDTMGALRQQISPRPITPEWDGFADADIDRATSYAAGLAMTNRAMRSGSSSRVANALVVDEAADLRLRQMDCRKGAEVLLVATIPADPGYPSQVLVCKDLKSPLVRLMSSTSYTPAASDNEDGTRQVLVIDSNLNVTARWVSYREMRRMETMGAMNNAQVECPSWEVARQATVAGSASPKNPYGYKAWSCFWNPNNVYTTSY